MDPSFPEGYRRSAGAGGRHQPADGRVQQGVTRNIARQPKRISVCGQFTATAQAEADLVLGKPQLDVHFDPDGTGSDWSDPNVSILSTVLIGNIGIEIDTQAR